MPEPAFGSFDSFDSFKAIRAEERSLVAYITLNRPEAYNAINLQMRMELVQALECVQANPHIRAVVLTGAGKAFSGGGDVTEITEERTLEQDLYRLTVMNRVIQLMRELPVPVIGAVNGVAAGAGFSLVLACDLVVAVNTAKFQMAFVGIGLGPDSGASHLLPRRVGLVRAKEIMLFGSPISAPLALEWGLINQMVEPPELEAAAAKLGEGLAQKSAPSIAAIKQLLNSGDQQDLHSTFAAETTNQMMLLRTPQHRAAAQAFVNRKR